VNPTPKGKDAELLWSAIAAFDPACGSIRSVVHDVADVLDGWSTRNTPVETPEIGTSNWKAQSNTQKVTDVLERMSSVMTIGAVLASKQPKRKQWLGSPYTECELCGRAPGAVFYDAYVPGNAWARICHECFRAYQCSTGEGRGQKYRLENGIWYKES